MFQQENMPLINKNLLPNENIYNILINQYKDKIIEEANNNKILLNSYKNNIMSFGNGNKINLNYHQIKYGIDENGNPINIKEYYKSINDSVNLNSNSSMQSGISNFTQKLKKPIAYITKDENNNNILVDLKGNKITTKNKEGDYDFNLQLHVIIKDFDVKHPELRINGERNYNNESMEEINEEPSENIKDKDKEKDCSHNNNNVGDSLSNINFNLNHNNENNCLIAGSCFSSSIRNDLGKILFSTNTDTYNNIGKYNNILGKNSRNNKIVLRTKDILTNNSSSFFKYKISGQNNTYINFGLEKKSKSLNKNKSQILPLKRSNTVTSNFIIFKSQRDNNKNDDTKNKKKAINLLFINNYSSKINKKKKDSQIFGNKYDNHQKIINIEKKNKKKANYPKKINYEKSTIQKNLNYNFYNNKKLATSTTVINNNNINKSIKLSKNYFVINHKKSVSNSKLIKKNYKRPNKRVNFIQINDKNNSSTKYTSIIDNKKGSNPNNISNNNHKITKRKILKMDLSQKSKKVDIQKKEKILNLQNMLKKNKNSHMYILSEEASNMIRSFSKNNIGKENQLNSSIRKINTNELSFKMTKMVPASKDSNNSLNLDNTYFSPNISKKDSNKINKQKCVGITLSLLINENKNLKGNTNNQININFTPYQIQCESLVKSNSENPYQRVHYNNNEKKNLKPKNKYNMSHRDKNFLSPKYQIYL